MSRNPKLARKVVYGVFILGLCIYVLIALAAVTFFKLDPAVESILNQVDTAVCILFLIDFCVRLILAKSKWEYLQWGWLDLISSIPLVEPLRWGRFARVLRILRLLRGLRAGKQLVEFLLNRRADSAFLATSFTALLITVCSSIAIYSFESEVNSNIQSRDDALWSAIVTITTVGYGDHYPVTSAGRIVAVITMVSGVGLFGAFTGFVASWFLEPSEAAQESEMDKLAQRLERIENQLEQLLLQHSGDTK